MATPLKADLIMLSVADANFRILVEYVHSCNVDCDLDGVACGLAGGGGGATYGQQHNGCYQDREKLLHCVFLRFVFCDFYLMHIH